MESQYIRVMTCSLNAYAAFWEELAASSYTSEDINGSEISGNLLTCPLQKYKQLSVALEKTKDIQTSILNEGKFWKMSQTKESSVSNKSIY